jgi:hypothetical protein
MFKQLILAFMAALGLMLLTASCDRIKGTTGGSQSDSLYVAEQIDAQLNPIFKNAAELIDHQQYMIEEISMNDAFLSLQPNILANVATVCINKDGLVTVKSCVEEYLKNQDVYDNLGGNLIPPTQDTIAPPTATEEQQLPVVVDSAIKKLKATQIDTIIDGKHVQLIKYQSNG